jgi:tRNA (cytidine/uridine-2'-O-)-methyltransferase
MDYVDHVDWNRHVSWERFREKTGPGRLVLLTTKASVPLQEFSFSESDSLLFGRESAGVPDEVHAAADARVLIPMRRGLRSLNIAVSASIALWEALRQTGLCQTDEG